MIAELNGTPIEAGDLAGLALINYGHFTSLVADDNAVRGLELHLDRLERDCQLVHGQDLNRDQTRRFIRQAARRIEGASVLRVTIFDPALALGHPGTDLHPQCLVTSRPAPAAEPDPITVATCEYVRDWLEVKHVGLFATVALRRAAQLDGFDDVAFCDAQGRLSEGATWNLGFVDAAGTVLFPDQPCLPGVTLHLLRDALGQQGIAWRERTITVEDAAAMAAGFVTNAAVGVRPMAAFGSTRLDTGHPMLARLRQVYTSIQADPI